MGDSLKKDNGKENFARTREPSGKKYKIRKSIFVVQEHNARNLHYDFRLEMNGALKSWALPKGIPKHGEKHLAVMTDDHSMDHANFEGTIPKGEYGAGIVKVWDSGNYENKTFEDNKLISMDEAVRRGKIHIELKGEKLKGDYTENSDD